MSDPNEKLWAAFTNPIHLPLVTGVPGGMLDNPALTGGATEPTLTVQLDTLGGKHFLLPVTVGAARRLILALAMSLQAQGYPLEPEQDEPPKSH
jgi:hypothetical protein